MSTEFSGQDSPASQPLNQSPTAPASIAEAPKAKPERMWFNDALDALLNRDSKVTAIRRLSWPEGECVFFNAVRFSANSEETTDILTIRKPDGSNHNWLIARVDLDRADDWVVME